MSELTATQCGCSRENSSNNCGCNSWIWIIIILFFLGGCSDNGNCGCGGMSLFNNSGCDNGNNCCEWIIILVLLFCCCGNNYSLIWQKWLRGISPGLFFSTKESVIQKHIFTYNEQTKEGVSYGRTEQWLYKEFWHQVFIGQNSMFKNY